MEDDLIAFYGAFVEDLRRDVLRRDVDALAPRFVQRVGEQAHLELETENVHAGHVLFAALQDDFFHDQPRDGQVHRPDHDQPSGLLAVKGGEVVHLLGPVGAQDQVAEGGFLFHQLPMLFVFAQVGVDADEVLPFVLAEVQNLEGAVVLAVGLELALHADHAFARGVDGEFAQVGADPLAAQLFRDRRGRAGAAEEVGDEVAFVGGGFDDAFDEFLRFLSRIICTFGMIPSQKLQIGPNIAEGFALRKDFVNVPFVRFLPRRLPSRFPDPFPPIFVLMNFSSQAFQSFIFIIRNGDVLHQNFSVYGFCIKINVVVLTIEFTADVHFSAGVVPYYFISKEVGPKNFVENDSDQTIYFPIAMDINASIFGQQIPHQRQPLVDHRDERVGTFSPRVAVGNLLQDVGFLGEGLDFAGRTPLAPLIRGVAPHFDVHRKIGPHVERRIDVDALQAALRLDFLAQRPVLQRRQNQFVVAPDEFVRPPLELPAAGVRRKERQLLSP